MKLSAIAAAALLGGSSLLASGLVSAQETGSGCGLGAQVLKGQSGKGANIAAAILNGLVIPNTTFMTTGGGLMGCDPTQTVQREEATEVFVASNMDQLSIDAAQGSGEHLNVLAQLMGVAEADHAAFAALTQSRYDALFAAGSDSKTLIDSLQVAMLEDQSLAKYTVN